MSLHSISIFCFQQGLQQHNAATTMTETTQTPNIQVSGVHRSFNMMLPALSLILVCFLSFSVAWSPSPHAFSLCHPQNVVLSRRTLLSRGQELTMKITNRFEHDSLIKLYGSNSGDAASDDEISEAIGTNQEEVLEQLSLDGAERIAKMDIPERTKRAMLAEQVEDRIFELMDVLDKLVENGEGSGELVKEENREKAVDVAREVKSLQKQYDDLVSGRPSSMLSSLESIMGKSEGDSTEDA